MPDKNLRLLILDDSLEDRTVVRFMLEEIPGRTWQFLEEEKGAAALHRLEQDEVDCILLDYQLPDMNGVRFLRELTQRFGPLRFPVVVFTGIGRASLAEQALIAGAQDYLSKDMIRVDSLVRAIDNSIQQVLLLREHQKQQEELETVNSRLNVLEAALREVCAPVLITDAATTPPGPRIIFVNPAFTALTGYTEEDVIGKTPKVLQGPKTNRDVLRLMRRDLITGRPFSGQIIHYRKDGSELTLNVAISPVQDTDGRTTHFVATTQWEDAGRAMSASSSGEKQTRPQTHGHSPGSTLLCSPLLYKVGTV